MQKMSANQKSQKLSKIRCACFDLDDTLYDFQAMTRRALEAPLRCIHECYPHTQGVLDIAAMVQVREAVAQQCSGPQWTLEKIRLEAFRRTLRLYAQPNDALASELQDLYLAARFRHTVPFSDVVPCFEALRPTFILGLISNGNSRAQQLGLEGYFDWFVLSEEVGFRKPDVRIFEHARQLASCQPDECLYVGDSPEHDIVGADRAGWTAVWLNRKKQEWPLPSVLLPLEVETLALLPSLLYGTSSR